MIVSGYLSAMFPLPTLKMHPGFCFDLSVYNVVSESQKQQELLANPENISFWSQSFPF